MATYPALISMMPSSRMLAGARLSGVVGGHCRAMLNFAYLACLVMWDLCGRQVRCYTMQEFWSRVVCVCDCV